MKAKLGVTEDLRDSLVAFSESESIPIEIVLSGDCTVRIEQPPERRQCDLSTLQAGGWIPCATARAMASKLQISILQTGKLIDFLNIKVRECGLGCFK